MSHFHSLLRYRTSSPRAIHALSHVAYDNNGAPLHPCTVTTVHTSTAGPCRYVRTYISVLGAEVTFLLLAWSGRHSIEPY